MVRRVARVIGWLLLVVVLVGIVAAAIYGLSQWHPTDDPRSALELISTRINWTAVASVVSAVAIVVVALFAIRLSSTTNREIQVATDQMAASAAARDAALSAAESAIWAVEASARATELADRAITDQRRQASLSATPILSLARPRPVRGPNGLELAAEARSNGPGLAINVRLELDVQQQGDQPWTAAAGAVAVASLLNAGDTVALRVPANDLQNPAVTWAVPWPGGAETPPPPDLLAPARIRLRLSWLSPAGGTVRLACIWETRDLAGDDSQSWRFEELRIEPGAGEPLVVA